MMEGVTPMIHLIVNPIAGNGRAKQIGALADAYLTQKRVEHHLLWTDHPRHATELARQSAQAGVETVISIGGDGTVTETAAGLIGTQTALGIVAAGTGNDFIKALGSPTAWRDALDFILEHTASPADAGSVNDRFFINVCGAGFDVMVLEYALSAKKHVRGIWPYLYGVIRAIKSFKPFPMRIEIGEDTVLDGKYMLCSIANGRFIGGGIPIAPMADITDGLFDIVAVDAIPRWKIPFYLPSLMMGKLHKRKIAHVYQTDRCRLSAPAMRLNLDGEIVPVEDVHFSCLHGSLNLFR